MLLYVLVGLGTDFRKYNSSNLSNYRVGVGWPVSVQETVPIYLRVEKHGEVYTFMYRHDPNGAWTAMASQDYTGTPTYVGLLSRVPYTGSEEMDASWSYFRLERWLTSPSTPTPETTGTPTATATPAGTATATPTQAFPTGSVTNS